MSYRISIFKNLRLKKEKTIYVKIPIKLVFGLVLGLLAVLEFAHGMNKQGTILAGIGGICCLIFKGSIDFKIRFHGKEK